MADAKPATSTKAKPAAKSEKPAQGVTLKDLASDVDRTPKSVRAAIRRHLGGAQVGQGGRYSWPSKKDKQYQELVKVLSKKEDTSDSE